MCFLAFRPTIMAITGKKVIGALSTGVSDAPGRAIRRVCPSTSSPNTVTSWRLPTIVWFIQQSSPQRNHGGAIVLCQGIVSALSCGGKKQECQWDRGASPYSSKVTHLMRGPWASPTQTDFRPSSPRQDKSQMKIQRMKQKKRPPQRRRCQQQRAPTSPRRRLCQCRRALIWAAAPHVP